MSLIRCFWAASLPETTRHDLCDDWPEIVKNYDPPVMMSHVDPPRGFVTQLPRWEDYNKDRRNRHLIWKKNVAKWSHIWSVSVRRPSPCFRGSKNLSTIREAFTEVITSKPGNLATSVMIFECIFWYVLCMRHTEIEMWQRCIGTRSCKNPA